MLAIVPSGSLRLISCSSKWIVRKAPTSSNRFEQDFFFQQLRGSECNSFRNLRRRICYALAYCLFAVLGEALVSAAAGDVEKVVYVNRYFEVREHSLPTKFIWNDKTRIAKATGSLSDSPRVQRLLLHSGWNLCALGVNLQPEQVDRLLSNTFGSKRMTYFMESGNTNWTQASGREAIPSGATLWIYSTGNDAVSLFGSCVSSSETRVYRNGFLSSPCLEAWTIEPTIVSNYPAAFWSYQVESNLWRPFNFLVESSQPSEPLLVPVGQAIFFGGGTNISIQMSDGGLGIQYYHQDYLGSTSCLTDRTGTMVVEVNYYPFGAPRLMSSQKDIRESYLFSGKEMDRESRLFDFETRFMQACSSTFLSPDKAMENVTPNEQWKLLTDPRNLHLYAYAKRSPTILIDPDGRHTKSRHAEITRNAMNMMVGLDIRFSESAIDRVVKGNLYTDDFQGNLASETRMHGMGGYVKDADGGLRIQSIAEAKLATQSFIESKTKEAVALAKEGKIGESLEAIGMATHAAQDRLQHRYAPWTAKGDSPMAAMVNEFVHHPVGLAVHGIKDVVGGADENAENAIATGDVLGRFVKELEEAGGRDLVNRVARFKGDP